MPSSDLGFLTADLIEENEPADRLVEMADSVAAYSIKHGRKLGEEGRTGDFARVLYWAIIVAVRLWRNGQFVDRH